MKIHTKFITLITLTAVMTSNLDAKEYCTDAGGYAYEEISQTCCLVPAVTFAIVAIAGIIALGVQNRGGHHSHSHAHTHSD